MGPTLPAVLLPALIPLSSASSWNPPTYDFAAGPARLEAVDLDEATAETPERTRDYLMEVNFRGRWLSVPDSILDIWFSNEDSDVALTNWPRPQVRAWSAGLEYVIRNDSANGIFYFEYVGSLIDEGYWDDIDDPPDYGDGQYLVPDRLGLLTLGADYAQEFHATEWLSFLIGGGLGILKVTGQMTLWRPGTVENPGENLNDPYCSEGSIANPRSPAYERYAAGCGDDGAKAIPPVLPIVDLNAGVRFHIGDRANLRIEGGLHDLLYVGVATGVVF
ncbi:MAG: hypothetical protein JXB39_00575 [Deltaproteobacteria bacterium]|nr:hypothetical protein [Deltaproteobacteria bacterium]